MVNCVVNRLLLPSRYYLSGDTVLSRKCNNVIVVFLLGVIVSTCLLDGVHADRSGLIPPRCEKITVKDCLTMKWNQTTYPNILNHDTQSEAQTGLQQFHPLIKVKCHEDIQLFLCSVFVPVCSPKAPGSGANSFMNIIPILKPCKEVCIAVKAGCEPVMQKFGFSWPDSLRCSQFRSSKDSKLCVQKNNTNSSSGGRSATIKPSSKSSQKPVSVSIDDLEKKSSALAATTPSRPSHPEFRETLCVWAKRESTNLACPKSLWVSRSHKNYRLDIGECPLRRGKDSSPMPCAAPCIDDSLLFEDKDRQMIRLWVGIWAILCLVSTIFTVFTFAIDRNRFRYPERPIIFLSMCYMMIAAAYVTGFLVKDSSVACNKAFDSSVLESETDKESIQLQSTVVQGTNKEWCTILFIVIYYFMMSSAIWWVILCITWFLAAGPKWSSEAIEANAQYFHLAAWAVPAVQTIAILAMQSIEGDMLANVCFVGVYNMASLRGFVLAPLVFLVLLGTAFLLAGLIALFRIRTVIRHDHQRTERFEKLIARIGLFSLLYILATGVTIGCYFYESSQRETWMSKWYLHLCKRGHIDPDFRMKTLGSDFMAHCPELSKMGTFETARPEYAVFMIKYFAILVVGVVSAIWIFNGKTMRIWANSCCHICNLCTGNSAAIKGKTDLPGHVALPTAHL